MVGIVFIAFIASCTVLSVLSVAFNWSLVKDNVRLRQTLWQLRLTIERMLYWYTRLYAWVLGQGLHPPTPAPRQVEKAEIK